MFQMLLQSGVQRTGAVFAFAYGFVALSLPFHWQHRICEVTPGPSWSLGIFESEGQVAVRSRPQLPNAPAIFGRCESATNNRSEELEALAKARAVVSEKTGGAESCSFGLGHTLDAVVSPSVSIAWKFCRICSCKDAKSELSLGSAQLQLVWLQHLWRRSIHRGEGLINEMIPRLEDKPRGSVVPNSEIVAVGAKTLPCAEVLFQPKTYEQCDKHMAVEELHRPRQTCLWCGSIVPARSTGG